MTCLLGWRLRSKLPCCLQLCWCAGCRRPCGCGPSAHALTADTCDTYLPCSTCCLQLRKDRAEFTSQAKLLSHHFTAAQTKTTALQVAHEALQVGRVGGTQAGLRCSSIQ